LREFGGQLALAQASERIVARLPAVLGDLPLRDDEALPLEAVECWIERPLSDLQHLLGPLLDPLGDAPAVHRFELQCFQYQHVERALQQIASFLHLCAPFDQRKKSRPAPFDCQGEADRYTPRVARNTRASILLLVLALGVATSASAQTVKQAVVETSAGTFIVDLDPVAAPNHVASFTKLAQAGGYEGTTFHRMVRMGMVQGGDPLSKDPAKSAAYGTGGLNTIKAEARAAKMTRGSVAAVLIPNRPDSAGAQFFIVLADQPALDNQYTVFGHVSEGMEALVKISQTPVDGEGKATERVEIRKVTIREVPVVAERFVSDTPEQLATYRAVLDTSAGPITLELLPNKAPETVRQFLRLAAAGVYDHTAFHRVVPGFVVQTGSLTSKETPLTDRQQRLVHNLAPEFNDTKHVKGVVSMARGDDPGSAQTSFFIVVGVSPTLDGAYTAFGRVIDGLAALDAIEAAPRTGEAPNTRIELKAVRIIN